jgi:hypothetical protein
MPAREERSRERSAAGARAATAHPKPSKATATTPSSQKWFAVTTTTRLVTTACTTASHRQRLALSRTTTTPTSTAHATCTEGIADSWSAMPRPTDPYTDCPYCRPVSTNPSDASIRGGATGIICTNRQAPVATAIVLRTSGYRVR